MFYILLEINPRMPRTLGDAAIHVSKLHALVPVEYELPNSTMHEANHEVVDKIADYVASLIPNGVQSFRYLLPLLLFLVFDFVWG